MRLVQVAQRAEDLERATAFYADLLGVPPSATYDPPGLVFFDLEGTRLMLEGNAPAAMLWTNLDCHPGHSRTSWNHATSMVRCHTAAAPSAMSPTIPTARLPDIARP